MKFTSVSNTNYSKCYFNMDYDSDILGIFIRKIGIKDTHYILGFLDRSQNELNIRHFTLQCKAEECLESIIQSLYKVQNLGS